MIQARYFHLETFGSDSHINQIITENRPSEYPAEDYPAFFNSNEDFYLRADKKFKVPSFPIYQDIKEKQASAEYIKALSTFLKSIIPLYPSLFYRMKWVNHYTEVLRPFFYRFLSLNDKTYLLLLKLDLIFKEGHGRRLEQDSTTHTAAYETEDLFCEILLLPQLSNKINAAEGFFFPLDIINTWTDEMRKNYALSGQWIDIELTRFFSRLFLPNDKNIYPYFPFIYQYHTIAFQLLNISENKLKNQILLLDQARSFLQPHLQDIIAKLKKEKFNKEQDLFLEIKSKVPGAWQNFCREIDTELFLNEINQQREFKIVRTS